MKPLDNFFAWLGRLFDNPTGVIVLVVTFILVLIALLAIPARAESRQELAIEAGAAVLRGSTPTLGFNWACRGCGPVNTDWEAGFELIGESTFRGENSNVFQVHGQLVDGWKRAELGIGFYALNVPQTYVCQFGVHLMARYRATDRLAVQWRHSSSAGSCEPNTGRDLVTVSYRFGKRQ